MNKTDEHQHNSLVVIRQEDLMTKIGLFYGSNEGHTEAVAERIQREFDDYEAGMVEIANIAQTSIDQLEQWDYLIFGIPTWNDGKLQDDWDVFLPSMDHVNLAGKKVAIFGLGDQYLYSYTFLDAVGILADKVRERGGELVGLWPAEGYEFAESRARDGDYLLGLAIDEDNEPERTAERIESWVAQLVSEFDVFELEAQPALA
jgi:flavodoxin I